MVQATSLYSKATIKPTDLGTVQWVRRCTLAAFLVLVRQPKPNPRKDDGDATNWISRVGHATVKTSPARKKALTTGGLPVAPRIHRQADHEAVSGSDANRGGFRDRKNRYGWSVAQANRYWPAAPRTNLLLIATLAAFLLWCIGVAGKTSRSPNRYA
ncbi:hypothetical protein [Nitrosospira briensis]|uniref:hypothetical protein n=1 Tax=Nitrosospira briensis TaxID=35799 RepID=UPI00046913ED|nr:hypothetical protein [Nitrosospira briensis]